MDSVTNMKIHQLLDRDPLRVNLANNGQARIAQGRDERMMRELRAELETFVCKGQFADALERILDRYLQSFDATRQDAVWVSGFFGSGKSHLLKMLAHLWENTKFADGQTARGLVDDRLPSPVRHALREIDMKARRLGTKPVATAGTVLGGNVGHVRLSVLSIMLRACGFPEQYPQARFCFWLRSEGVLDEVRGGIEAAGKDWNHELNNLYVSPVLANAVTASVPGFAADAQAARQLFIQQFRRPRADISTEQFVEVAKKVLAPGGGEVPPTIVVLDEVQQYINEASDRAQIVTDLAEALQTRFDSRVLLVASGQSALAAGNAALQWLKDRFRVTVQLADAEVEAVTREVLLRKKPTAEPAVSELLERHAGEVARHLQGTRLALRTEDKPLEVGDYPLLRTRRRFWEACFQTTDPSGTRSQLRSQLRILHDSLRRIAKRPLGAVIPASDLFRSLAHDLVGSSVLLNEINTRIRKLDDDTSEGRLKADLCGVVFLIGKLPREEVADTGVRASATTLADLLVDDLRSNSGAFRTHVARTLERLADEGVLMTVEEEYRIQTREGAEWERAFREERTRLAHTEVEIASRRDDLLATAVQQELAGVRPTQGEAKVARQIRDYFGMDVPTEAETARGSGGVVWVWVRNGWSCSDDTVVGDARAAGMEDAVLHVHVPRRSPEALRDHITRAEAARNVLDRRGMPASPEGAEARESMKSRLAAAEAARDLIVEEAARAARVFRGGGQEVFGEGLRLKIEAGVEASLVRLFPRFREGDHSRWGIAFKRIREGTGTPFEAVGWDQAVADHPVVREVLLKIGAGSTGRKVQNALKVPPYGWPKDAIDAALLALCANDHLKAEHGGLPVSAQNLTQQNLGKAHYRPERVLLTAVDRLKIRKIYQQVDVDARSGQESTKVPEFLEKCRTLAQAAGGDAPLPQVPDTRFLEDLSGQAGNEQLAAILRERERIEQCVGRWKKLGKRASGRRQAWGLATALHRHAEGELGDVAVEVGEQLDAIREQRSLLGGSDPVGRHVTRLANALREELLSLRGRLDSQVKSATQSLAGDPTWKRLEPAEQEAILSDVGLTPPHDLGLGTNEQLAEELGVRPLSAWRSEIDAVPTLQARALGEAAERLPGDSPAATYVSVRRGTLDDEEAVRTWIAEHREKLVTAVRSGPVIVE